MKLHLIYILLTILTLVSCQHDEAERPERTGTLALQLYRGAVPHIATRAIDADLALDVIKPDGTLLQHYAPGAVPAKITLTADVTYTLKAYTDNQDTWASAREGKGEACYIGETTVTVGEDDIEYVTYAVPMTNYAVTLTLPDKFEQLFKSYTLTLTCGNRTTNIKQQGDKAYFAPGTPFSYKLTATNTDDKTSYTETYECDKTTEAGKLYNIKYGYDFGQATGGIDIEITDNTEHQEIDMPV